VPQAAAQTNPEPAIIRVTHLSPNTPDINVYLDGERIFLEQSYATTSAFRAVAPGPHQVIVSLAADDANVPIAELTIDLIRGRPYTLAVINTLEDVEAVLLRDSTDVPEPGQTRVRVVHAAPNAGLLDVWPVGSPFPILTDQYFGQVDYVNVPAGEYVFNFTAAGSPDVLLTSQQLRFEPGWTYTIAVTGTAPEGEEPLIVHAAVDRVGG